MWGGEPGWRSGENETWKTANGEQSHLFQGCASVCMCVHVWILKNEAAAQGACGESKGLFCSQLGI